MCSCLRVLSVKNKKSDIVVSAGNTGALLVIAKLNLKMIENIDKPALAALWPNKKNMSVVLDLGANIECSSWPTLLFLAHTIACNFLFMWKIYMHTKGN